MPIRILASLLLLILSATGLHAQVLTTANVQIEWKVSNRFRLFADAEDFKQQERSWRQYLSHVDGLGKPQPERDAFVATTSVIGIEHVLNDRYIPFSQHLRTKYQPRGWASTMTGKICYDSKTRKHSACGSVEDYVMPKAHDIEVWLKPLQADTLFAEYNCEWRINDGPAFTVPCDEPATLTLPYPDGGTVSVNVEGERPISQAIQVKDLLIVGLGDSFASGEGNPDVPVAMAQDFRSRNVFPRRERNDTSGNAQWTDELCHRSLYSYQLRAALQIAIENPQSAVTFLGYSCSGASVEEGILGPQTHMDYVSRTQGGGDSIINSVKGGSNDNQIYWLLRDICLKRPQEENGFNFCPGSAFRRNVDLVLLSVGGNDIGFSQLVTWATLRDNTSAKVAKFFGTAASPKTFADNMQKTLPKAYARLAKALEIAVPLRLEGNVFDASRVVLTAYPDILEDENGDVCPAGKEGEKEMSYAANQTLNVYGDWLVVTARRLGLAHEQLEKLHNRMRELSEDHGWTFAGKAYEGRPFRGHGFCARNPKAGQQPTEQLVLPCWIAPGEDPARCSTSWSGGERIWAPYNPATEAYPYALRQRWVRTFNDAYMIINQKVTNRAGQIDERASGAVFSETTGAMHPTAEGHAAMADAVLLDLRGKVAEMLNPDGEP
ncbi:MAG: hypothetical protein LCH46_15200 [Proteobacteria bacterium]|nr:hypothetical protein [Pseudomonadota bacterium]